MHLRYGRSSYGFLNTFTIKIDRIGPQYEQRWIGRKYFLVFYVYDAYEATNNKTHSMWDEIPEMPDWIVLKP